LTSLELLSNKRGAVDEIDPAFIQFDQQIHSVTIQKRHCSEINDRLAIILEKSIATTP